VGEVTEPDDPGIRAVTDRYVQAFEAADVPALVRLLADEAVLEMPPVPVWYQGSRDYGLFVRRLFDMHAPGRVMRQLTANGQPALAAYAPEPGGGHRLQTLRVFTVTGGRVHPTSCSPTRACSRRLTCPGRSPRKTSADRDESGQCRRYIPVSTNRKETHRERHRH
jgi:SnoaL-like domain